MVSSVMTRRPSGTCDSPSGGLASTESLVMSCPSRTTRPEVEGTNPEIVLSRVVFPVPLAPRTAVMRPL